MSDGTRQPKYRHHKARDLAVVRIDGKDLYLGRYGTLESRAAYDRVIAEWLANGRSLPINVGSITVSELVLRYWRHAESYYRKNGSPTGELSKIKVAMRPLRRLYGADAAREFGPLKLKVVRTALADSGNCRSTINTHIGYIKRMFKWAVENELVSPSAYQGLQAVAGLKRGRCNAREMEPVRPVPEEYVRAVLSHVSRQVAAMIELQTLTGMRTGEVTIMRTIDIDTTANIWLYVPFTHKTEHHNKLREVYLGQRAQEVLRPFLRSDLEPFMFSPVEAESERNANRRDGRKSRLTPSQAARKRKLNRKRPPQDRYTTGSFRRAITRGCDLADARARSFTPPFNCPSCDRQYE